MAIPAVQTALAKKAVSALNENFNLNASIEKIKIGFPNKIYVTNAFLPDEHQDTLFYINKLKIEITGFNTDENMLRTSEVKLENGRIYMHKWPEDSAFNFQLFLNRFKKDKPKDLSKKGFKWKAAFVKVDNMRFIKERINCENSCTNIFLDSSSIHVKDFFLNGSYVDGEITSFVYKDRHRFDLKSFSGKIAYHPNYIKVENLQFTTDRSIFDGDFKLAYDTISDLMDFVRKVEVISDIRKAEMASDEFISWLDIFPDVGDFKLIASTSGTINELSCSEIDLEFGRASSFFGDVKLVNTTDAKNIYLDAGISYLKTNEKDLERYVYPLIGTTMSEEIRRLGTFSIKGKYKGGGDDLLADGTLISNLGKADLDIHLIDLKNVDKVKYVGDIALTDFDIGALFNLPGVGTISLKGDIKGQGISKNEIFFDANLDINHLNYKQYNYRNIEMKGHTSERLFTGEIFVNDPSLDIDFDGTIDFNQDTALLDFRTNIQRADLYALNLDKDTLAEAQCQLDIELKYLDESWFEGYINLFNTTFVTSELFYFFDSVAVTSSHVGGTNDIQIKSQILNASLLGDFNVTQLVPSFKTITSKIYHLYKYEPKNELDMDCSFKLQFNNTELLSSLFVPGLEIEPGTELSGQISMPENELKLNFYSPGLKFDDHDFRYINLNFLNKDTHEELKVKVGIYDHDKLEIDSTELAVQLFNDSITYGFSTIIKDSIDTYFKMRGYALEDGDSNYFIHIDRSRFNLGLQNFNLAGENNIILSKEQITLTNVGIIGEHGWVELNGVLSDNKHDVMRIETDSLDLATFNYFIGKKNIKLNGIVNGVVLVNSGFKNPKIISSVTIDSLMVNDAWVGNSSFSTDWVLANNYLNFDILVDRRQLRSLDLEGTFYPDSNNYIDADLKLNRFRADIFNAFLVGILDHLRGTLSGDVAIHGPINDPKIDGEIELNSLAMRVPYLNSDFNVEGKPVISISDTLFSLNRVPIRDTKEGSKGWISGAVSHHFFRDINFDLKVEADKLLAMDLTKEESDFFYGKGYATGDLKIIGPIKDLVLEMNLKTERGTDFKIPVFSPKEVGQNNFITFIGNQSKFENLLEETKKEVKLGGLTLRLNITATPEAKIELIMDETVGDIIRARGKGNIRLEMSPDGEFTMFGDYEIEKGDYLFTMRNLINKPFVLKSGSNLSWTGDPYLATLDLNAVYSTRTSLTGVVTSPDYQDQKVKVELYLNLKGLLTNPNIVFDIKLPGSSTSWQEELNNRFTNVDKLNQQAFSLLLLNSFWVESSAENNVLEQGFTANTSQMIFSQMSNWISSGTDFIDINMSYSQSNNAEYADEIELELSKSFYDDRVTVNGILDVPVGTPTVASSSTSQSFTGDIEVLYRITPEGNVQVKFFNRSNQNNPTRDQLDPYTQGIGILYRKDFDNLKMLFGNAKKEKEVKIEEKSSTEEEQN